MSTTKDSNMALYIKLIYQMGVALLALIFCIYYRKKGVLVVIGIAVLALIAYFINMYYEVNVLTI